MMERKRVKMKVSPGEFPRIPTVTNWRAGFWKEGLGKAISLHIMHPNQIE